jgi:hypothetical protein
MPAHFDWADWAAAARWDPPGDDCRSRCCTAALG